MENIHSNRIEYRLGMDGNYYTQREFFEYYGGYIEWGFNHPLNIQRREVLLQAIKYEKDLNKVKILVDKLVSI